MKRKEFSFLSRTVLLSLSICNSFQGWRQGWGEVVPVLKNALHEHVRGVAGKYLFLISAADGSWIIGRIHAALALMLRKAPMVLIGYGFHGTRNQCACSAEINYPTRNQTLSCPACIPGHFLCYQPSRVIFSGRKLEFCEFSYIKPSRPLCSISVFGLVAGDIGALVIHVRCCFLVWQGRIEVCTARNLKKNYRYQPEERI